MVKRFQELGIKFSDQEGGEDNANYFQTQIRNNLDLLNRSVPLKPLEIFTKDGVIFFQMKIMPDRKLYIRQAPLAHGIHGNHQLPSFEALEKILKEGFLGNFDPNVVLDLSRKTSGLRDKDKRVGKITFGDKYTIELMAPSEITEHTHMRQVKTMLPQSFVSKAAPQQILKVKIKIDKRLPKEQIAAKKAFYKEHLKGWPIAFEIADSLF
ncbi:MAG TPA: hypothetical protein VFF13_06255 [archaeon]|nr:hypothetical protein [archaeon]